MKVSILEYLGKWEGGILVLLSIEYLGNFFEGIFYYTIDKMIVNVEEKLIKALGSHIELWDGYLPFMDDVINQVEPYELIIQDLTEVDPTTLLY